MSATSSSFAALSSLLQLIPLLILTGGCAVYLVRARNIAGVVLLVSNLLSVALSLVWTVLRVLMSTQNLHWGSWAYALQVVGFVIALGFGVGFVLMAFATPRKDAAG